MNKELSHVNDWSDHFPMSHQKSVEMWEFISTSLPFTTEHKEEFILHNDPSIYVDPIVMLHRPQPTLQSFLNFIPYKIVLFVLYIVSSDLLANFYCNYK